MDGHAQNDAFSPYRVDDLVLLVGENPLPNAVAARLLLKPGGKAWLVKSSGTRDEAQLLARYLRQHGFEVPEIRREINEASPTSILDTALSILDKASGPNVGVNYTGGTKVMATHSYRAAEVWAHEHARQVWLSYLDARRQEMVFTRSGKVEEATVPLSSCPVAVSLNELRQLHGLGGSPDDHPLPPFSRTAEVIAKEIPSMGAEAWKLWKEALKTGGEPRPTCPGLKRIESALREEAGLSAGVRLTKQVLARARGCTEHPIALWADGAWLEQHVLTVLQGLAGEVGLTDCARGYQTDAPHFELDVLAMRYHQLFVFSCGTTLRRDDSAFRECKLKLMEARTRARQFGGDEAAVALICLLDGGCLQHLRSQVPDDDRLYVFGLPDLRDLRSRLKDWILTQVAAPGA
ncbi:MAG TPA: hypothetical protein PLU39_03350 [Armatimonadota bacterium]|jgi:hypothetical protein|nr:hypothetical protein [Armatimonadota bacterium]HOM80969.1 hypothetical protein [Armatimonadota bacterium]HPO74951.1 hypothetical protein [Armatimonadota bacterium]HPT96885.1 hypothetical protein [Armatimonadota bacterium]